MNLLIEKLTDEILFLRLHRPAVHNALNKALMIELTETLKKIDQDESIRVVCLAGSGKHFCTGGDLSWMQKSIDFSVEENIEDAKLLSALFHTLYSLSKPTIALIQGAAYGGAIGLIACCDIALASSTARFSFSEVKLGLVPAVISPYVIKAIGERHSKRYFLTAEVFDADIAKKMALIHEVVPEENLVQRSQALAQVLLKNSSPAMKKVKQLFPPIEKNTHQSMIKMLAEIRTSKEAQKRMREFLNH